MSIEELIQEKLLEISLNNKKPTYIALSSEAMESFAVELEKKFPPTRRVKVSIGGIETTPLKMVTHYAGLKVFIQIGVGMPADGVKIGTDLEALYGFS